MKVVELINVVRRETPLHYRRTYTATAVLAHSRANADTKRIEFVLEHSPLGPVDVRVKFLDEVNYPLLPALRVLKEHISRLETNGELP